ncbi:hypothetical protein REJC140_01711 [Pseudorhizobium endolithicum]|uniref:Uncharacterized protein n=1 Tax=Pseudorhizobium endolithicum TaxID=1191678 RepID=A0ABM8PVV2_9HYPH|nr:hypothetical protein [Pseudorhizobium endolithicum]CAD6427507.1 hypothetical protein REQ54_03026 [Rhizobium sp. Q54]CAD7051331.1 hypothetical protein REJC140_01711 [Pseudorhizobium endolithicum]
MSYHYSSRRPAKGGFGTAILFMLAVIAGGGFLAASLEDGPSSARVYLAEDLNAAAR